MYLHSWLLFLVISVLKEVNSVVVDLSHSYRNYTTTCWEPTEHFDIFAEDIGNGPNGWYATESFSMSEHCGTHIDAPFHFYQFGWKLGDIPLERLIVQGKLYTKFEVSTQYTHTCIRVTSNSEYVHIC